MALDRPCPCGGLSYRSCCGPLHRGERLAATAEQLMRSRYSAYALGELEYLLRTHSSPEPLARRRRELGASLGQVRWQRLCILATTAGGPADPAGTVTFEAHYAVGGQAGVMRECSLFGREGNRPEGRWLYLKALELSDSGSS
ncbi:YchJ family protein [Vulcanococcus limneticus]|uniref:YchJ family protein n=1 Tax=Vulcanococcus limneticus TaxID=2170428 RepID=UPI00398C0A7B